jgi:Protein of unknown function (DUF1176)
MKTYSSLWLSGLLLMCVNFAFAKEENSFTYKDWALTCDNTRTCRAEGYQEEIQPNPISILLTRVAGTNTPVDVQIQVASEVNGGESYESSDNWKLYVGKLVLSGNPDVKSLTWHLTANQVKQLLPELLQQSYAILTDGNISWELSLSGAKAMLLKMDEKQGRLSTPSALVKRGSRDESKVPKPILAPQVYVARLEKQRSDDKKLGKLILKGINKDDFADCNDVYETKAPEPELYRLTNTKVLVSIDCPMGAYNYTDLLWIANDKSPYQPKLQVANGEFSDGAVHESYKGRGLGDCWYVRVWYFDGKEFVLGEEKTTGMCRGFAGGAWDVPTRVSRVKKR